MVQIFKRSCRPACSWRRLTRICTDGWYWRRRSTKWFCWGARGSAGRDRQHLAGVWAQQFGRPRRYFDRTNQSERSGYEYSRGLRRHANRTNKSDQGSQISAVQATVYSTPTQAL